MSEEDSRFKDLLQPLKDLASNWDIDIAESLTEYLEELSELPLDEAEKNTLNFAQAALLIQNSTAVYSLKVEHLHKLVQQSLEFIINGKQKSTNASSSNEGQDKARGSTKNSNSDECNFFGSDPSFILLDDVVEVGKNIDLITFPASKQQQQQNVSLMSMGADTSMLSIKSLMNSVLGGNHDQGGSMVLKLSSCAMDGMGALLIGGISDNQQVPDRLTNLSQSKISLNDSSSSILNRIDGKDDFNDDFLGT